MAITVSQLKAQFTADTADLEQGVARAARASDKAAGDINAAGGKAENAFAGIGSLLSGAVVGGAIAAGAAIFGVGAASVSMASDARQSVNDLQASLGLTTSEAQALGGVATEVWKNNFGANIQEAAAAVGLVRQQMGDLGGDAGLQQATQAAFALKDVFGVEVNQSIDAAKTLMSQFGLSGAEAMDFIASGFQQGLDRSGDFLDSIGEYATQFSSGGASAEGFFSVMQSGLQGGMLGTDKAADAFKEFRVRIMDGSDSTVNALTLIGLNAQDMYDQFRDGSLNSAQAFQMVNDALNKTDLDPVDRMQAGVGLLGTQFEDLGTQGALALSLTGAKMSDMGGAVDSLNAKYNNWGSLATGVQRQILAALQPIGDGLLDIANSALPVVTAALSGLTEGLASGVQSAMPYITALQNGFSALASGDAGFLGDVADTLSEFGVISEGAATALYGMGDAFDVVLQAASGMAAQVGPAVSSAFQSIGQVAQTVFNALPGYVAIGQSVLASFASFVSSTLAGAFQIIGPIAQSVFSGIATIVQTAMPGVMSLASAVGGLLSAAFGALQAVAVSVFAAIQPYIPAVQAAIGNLAAAIGGVLNTAFQTAANFVTGAVVPALTNLGAWLADNLPSAIQVLANFWTGVLQPAVASVAGWITGTLIPLLGELWGWVQSQLPGALQVLSSFWTGTLQPAIVQVAGWITGTLFPLFGELVNWLTSTITAGLQTLSNFWQTHGDTILTIAQTAWDGIQAVVDTVLATLESVWAAWNAAREGDWRGFGENLRAIWDGAWQTIIDVVQAAWPTIINIVVGIVDGIRNTFTSIDWGAVGTAVVEGIANGIRSGLDFVMDAARNVAEAALKAAKAALGIASPSQEMYEQVGVPMAQGLGLGFAAGMATAMPGIVASVRAVMEQIAAALKGVGDSVSMSDWEDLAGPVGLMVDMFADLADMGKVLATTDLAGTLATAQAQVKGLVSTTKSILTDLAPLLKGIGGPLSTSDWEDFVAPLKHLADSLTAIGSISDLFSGDSVPSLTGLRDQIVTLATEAQAILAALDPVTVLIGQSLVDKLKALGDGTAGAKSVAENTFGLVKALVDALAFDWGSVNFSAIGKMMTDLVIIAEWLIGKAQLGLASLDELDVAGLSPLKAGLDSILPLATMIPAGVTALIDALNYNWGGVNFGAVGGMMEDLVAIGVYLIRRGLDGIGVLADLETDVLGQLKTSLDNILPLIDHISLAVKALVAALTFNWQGVNFGAIGGMMESLVLIAVYLTRRALDGIAGFDELETEGLAPLNAVIQSLLGIVGNTRDLITGLTAAMTMNLGPIAQANLETTITRLVAVGIGIANAANRAIGTWSGVVTPAMTNLGNILAASLAIVVSTFDIIAAVASGGNIPNAGPRDTGGLRQPGAGGTGGATRSPLEQAIYNLVNVGEGIANAVSIAIRGWSGVVTPAMTELGRILEASLSIVANTFDIIKAVTSGGNIPNAGPRDVGGLRQPGAGGTGDTARSPLEQRIFDLVNVAEGIASAVASAITGWTGVLTPAMTELGKVLSASLSIVTDTLDIVGAVSGERFPDVRGGALDIIKTRVRDLVLAARQIADAAQAALEQWTITVNPVMERLGEVLGASLDVVSSTLDIIATVSGERFPDLSAGPLALIKTRIDQLIRAARPIADTAQAALETWTITVNPVMGNLGRVLGDALSVASDTLDLITTLGGERFPDLTGGALDLIKTRLDQLIRAARPLADAAQAALETWTITVNPVMGNLGRVIGDALGVASDTLDLVGTLGGERFPDLSAGAMAILKTRLTQLVGAARELADEAQRALEQWSITVKPAWAGLSKVIGEALSVASDTLDLVGNLGGERFPDLSTGAIAILKDRLFQLVSVAKELADEAQRAIGAWSITVKPAMAGLAKVLGDVLGVAGDTLDLAGLLSGNNFPDLSDGVVLDMSDRLTLIIDAGEDLADAANTAIGLWTIEVKPALANLGKVLGETVGIVTDVLDFNKLTAAILSFRGLDMSLIGPKIDLIFAAAIAIAERFGSASQRSNVTQAFVDAGAKVSALFGDASSSLKDALDLGASLLDPETQIPSIGQIQGKVDALFNVIQAIAAQFATRATAAASAGMNFEQVRTYAETVKGVFESIREVAAAVADFTGVSLGASGFNNISQVLNAVFTLFEQVAGRASVVSQVSAAIASVLGGLANLVSAESFQTGVDIGTRIADGIAAGLTGASATIGSAILTAVSSGDTAGRGLGTPGVAPGGGVGGGSVVNNYYTNNSTTKNLTVQQIINTTPAGIGPASNSLYGLLAGN